VQSHKATGLDPQDPIPAFVRIRKTPATALKPRCTGVFYSMSHKPYTFGLNRCRLAFLQVNPMKPHSFNFCKMYAAEGKRSQNRSQQQKPPVTIWPFLKMNRKWRSIQNKGTYIVICPAHGPSLSDRVVFNSAHEVVK
jgi:hypothetical protein